MTKYVCRPLLLSKLSQMHLKHFYATKREREKVGFVGALKELLSAMPEALAFTDGSIMCEEWRWIQSGRSLIFPDTLETLQLISRSTFRIQFTEALESPYECFVVNIPKGFELAGQPCPAVMVAVSNMRTQYTEWVAPFLRTMGLEHMATEPENLWTVPSEQSLAITYKTADTPFGPEFGRLCVGWDMLPEILQCKTGAEFSQLIGQLPGVGLVPGISALSEDESLFQLELTRMVIKLMLYVQATGAMTPGFPSQTRDESIPLYWTPGRPAQAMTLKLAAGSGGVPASAHYRSFTLRQLTDERYYQGEYSRMPRGSRLVFVRDTFVGAGDVDPQTLRIVDRAKE